VRATSGGLGLAMGASGGDIRGFRGCQAIAKNASPGPFSQAEASAPPALPQHHYSIWSR
jgi:hypothetical protein